MSKRIPTPGSGDDEPKYHAVVRPYPMPTNGTAAPILMMSPAGAGSRGRRRGVSAILYEPKCALVIDVQARLGTHHSRRLFVHELESLVIRTSCPSCSQLSATKSAESQRDSRPVLATSVLPEDKPMYRALPVTVPPPAHALPQLHRRTRPNKINPSAKAHAVATILAT
ncbi:hypothetical protein C8R45DRAFT_1095810 [Mycena sanguinolenta]|nr:hypothetical protein C8R45DRAFT_1095810 [Mycena sanguinolenta]